MVVKNKIVFLLCCYSLIFFIVSINYGYFSIVDKTNNEYYTLAINGWKKKDIENGKEILDSLQTSTTIFGNYYRNDHEWVNLYVGGYRRAEKAKMSHAPQVCFVVQGWRVDKSDKYSLTSCGPSSMSHKVNRLMLVKGEDKLLVYFWYQTTTRMYDDLYIMKFDFLLDKFVPGIKDERNVFVRVLTEINDNQEKATQLLDNYVIDLFQELPFVLNNIL